VCDDLDCGTRAEAMLAEPRTAETLSRISELSAYYFDMK